LNAGNEATKKNVKGKMLQREGELKKNYLRHKPRTEKGCLPSI